ncbi:hypothetical protein SADUNF_Sadunf18G0074700 [Salix dunnii]|uniref:Uncharacterized protein n=1 Tax=Salix dunnii TaxID=1413687 RepID=A0A835J5Y8_9ROSI|nr:hypothetical protein SADUNF_Sadunf18G0074700 [Salix dunnii]
MSMRGRESEVRDWEKMEPRGIARHGRINRINDVIYKETKGVLEIFLENMICDAINLLSMLVARQ